MKIKINDYESYEINTLDEITLVSLTDLVERLNNAFPSERITTYSSGHITRIEPRTIEPNSFMRAGKLVTPKKRLGRPPKNPDSNSVPSKPKKPYKRKHKWNRGTVLYRSNRDELIKVIKLHYFGNKEDKNKYAEGLGMVWQTDIVKGLDMLRKRNNITPKEVGMDRFPSRHEAVGRPKKNQKKDELLSEVQYY